MQNRLRFSCSFLEASACLLLLIGILVLGLPATSAAGDDLPRTCLTCPSTCGTGPTCFGGHGCPEKIGCHACPCVFYPPTNTCYCSLSL
jgi:hypothetical protein